MNSISLGDGPSLLSDAQNPLREFVRAYGLLERVMHPYFQEFGVTPSQWGMLRTLWRAEQGGEPGLRLTDLSERLLVRPPSVTATVARLRRASLLRRERVAGDGRAWLIQLTPKGRRLVQRVLHGHEQQLQLLLEGLSARQQEEMLRIMRQWSEHLQRLADTSRPQSNGQGPASITTARKLARRS